MSVADSPRGSTHRDRQKTGCAPSNIPMATARPGRRGRGVRVSSPSSVVRPTLGRRGDQLQLPSLVLHPRSACAGGAEGAAAGPAAASAAGSRVWRSSSLRGGERRGGLHEERSPRARKSTERDARPAQALRYHCQICALRGSDDHALRS